MNVVDPELKKMLGALVSQVQKIHKTDNIDFTEVEGIHFNARFAPKDSDLIFHFFGKHNRLPTAIPTVIGKAFHEVLGDVGMERVTIEVLPEEVTKEGEKIEGGQTVFVRAKNYATPMGEAALVPRVFEIVQNYL